MRFSLSMPLRLQVQAVNISVYISKYLENWYFGGWGVKVYILLLLFFSIYAQNLGCRYSLQPNIKRFLQAFKICIYVIGREQFAALRGSNLELFDYRLTLYRLSYPADAVNLPTAEWGRKRDFLYSLSCSQIRSWTSLCHKISHSKRNMCSHTGDRT